MTQLSQFYAIILRRYYTEITQNKLRNHYAYKAIITQINYAVIRTKVTQIITVNRIFPSQ